MDNACNLAISGGFKCLLEVLEEVASSPSSLDPGLERQIEAQMRV
jgi:hypothetical protein